MSLCRRIAWVRRVCSVARLGSPVSLSVSAAWRSVGVGELLYACSTREWLDEFKTFHDSIGMWMGDEPEGVDEPDLVLDLQLSGEGLDDKRAVLAGHRSQTEMIASVMGERRYRDWIRRESFRRPTAADLRGLVEADLTVAAA